MALNEQMVEEHSTLEQQPLGRLNHPAWCIVSMVQPTSTVKHSEDTDVNLCLSEVWRCRAVKVTNNWRTHNWNWILSRTFRQCSSWYDVIIINLTMHYLFGYAYAWLSYFTLQDHLNLVPNAQQHITSQGTQNLLYDMHYVIVKNTLHCIICCPDISPRSEHTVHLWLFLITCANAINTKKLAVMTVIGVRRTPLCTMCIFTLSHP